MDAITTKHEEQFGLVGTHQRGSIPIDGIFASSSVSIIAAGCYPIGYAPSDHRAVWIKVSISDLFGKILFNSIPVVARRLQCQHPRAVKNFQDFYLQDLKKRNLFERIYHIQQEIEKGAWSSSLE